MSEQRTLMSVVYDSKRKVTRRARFLHEMDAVIPWARLEALVASQYAKPGRGRRPVPLGTMLRVYFLQQWFELSDPAAEDMLYDSESMRRFARVEPGEDTVPDASTILRFRHLLERHQLTAQMFEAVTALLEERRLLLKAGTIVDATIIGAPSSTKNATQTRAPEMKQTRKGHQWFFGMKLHVGTDRRGLVHSLTTTDAAVADITQLPDLLHGQETTLWGDKAYYSTDHQLPCGEASVELHESAVPRVGEEHRAGLRGLRPGEPVLGARQVGGRGHVVSARAPNPASTGRDTAQWRPETVRADAAPASDSA